MKIYHHVDDSPESLMNSAMTGREVVVLDNEGKEYMSIWLPQEPLYEEGIWKERWDFLKKWIDLSHRHTTEELLEVMEEMEKK